MDATEPILPAISSQISAETAPLSFDARVRCALASLTPAEVRTAQHLLASPEIALIGSAAQIAGAVGTSDATVIRTARSLGYAGLSDMRADILAGITGAASPAGLLNRTLEETGSDPARVLDHVAGLHGAALIALRRPEMVRAFGAALDLIAGAANRFVFGIGPSGALADYATLQLNRIGLRTHALTATGIGLADRLVWLGPGDTVVMLAYAPLYREAEMVLERSAEVGAQVILISDTLGLFVAGRVAQVLAMPRGRADHLAMHGGTMVLIEALVLGLAAMDRTRAVDALDDFSTTRARIDRGWLKRGTRRPVDGP